MLEGCDRHTIAVADQPIPYIVTDSGRAYVRAFTECLLAGYPTRTAVEIAERARDATELRAETMRPRPQLACCCTQGVMDADNPHLWGECSCTCHEARKSA
jgi:hypothetical protein